MSPSGVDAISASACIPVVGCNGLVVAAGYEAVLRANKLDSLEALFRWAGAESLGKPGLSPWRERLRLKVEYRGERYTLYLKRFVDPPWRARRRLRASGTGASSQAGLEWAWMNLLAREGIACAEPVALGEELNGSRESRSAILTAEVPGRSLEAWSREWVHGDRATARRVLAPLAALVARLHRLGYVHRDLYLSHVFWDPGSPLETSLCLIDLQRVLRPRRRRWMIKDLAALNFSAPAEVFSATYRVRWLKQYLGLPKLDPAAKRLAYRVIGKTLSIARHEQHRGARFRPRNKPR